MMVSLWYKLYLGQWTDFLSIILKFLLLLNFHNMNFWNFEISCPTGWLHFFIVILIYHYLLTDFLVFLLSRLRHSNHNFVLNLTALILTLFFLLLIKWTKGIYLVCLWINPLIVSKPSHLAYDPYINKILNIRHRIITALFINNIPLFPS